MSDPDSKLDDDYALWTWRWLRLAMLLVVVGLAAAVVYEIARVGCVKGSISAYYYSPARGVFVGALIGIAVCLLCLRGSDEREDALLNIAGVLAPVVAFVPTPATSKGCRTLHAATEDSAANIANNVHALLVVGLAALALMLYIVKRHRTRPHWIAWGSLAGVCVATLVALEAAPGSFKDAAHIAAAVPMFGCITAVVAINARFYKEQTDGTLRNRYTVIAIAMGLAILAGLIAWRAGSEHAVFGTEVLLLALFGGFWWSQTEHLWDRGLWGERGREP